MLKDILKQFAYKRWLQQEPDDSIFHRKWFKTLPAHPNQQRCFHKQVVRMCHIEMMVEAVLFSRHHFIAFRVGLDAWPWDCLHVTQSARVVYVRTFSEIKLASILRIELCTEKRCLSQIHCSAMGLFEYNFTSDEDLFKSKKIRGSIKNEFYTWMKAKLINFILKSFYDINDVGTIYSN